MRIGICILPEDRWSVAAEKWKHAENLGFAHAWTYDHLNWRDLRDGPWHAAMPTLTAAATVTSTIRLGTLVASPNFRHPVPFAREVITLDDVSRGRFLLGLGAGGEGWDATILGQQPWSAKERGERFAEFVELLDALLRDRAVTLAGRYYAANDMRTQPGCEQQPRVPFAIAATGPKGMALAARYGSAWVTTGPRGQTEPLSGAQGAAMVREQMAALHRACEAEGRDPSSIDRIVLTGLELDDGLRSPDAFAEVKAAYASVGVTDLVIHWPRASGVYEGDASILDELDLT
jgi:alkanesulfonate monooxygenase SsuD/methylene tetrahydromethanopterin reductase-like flavin-dependent oxidoreductase (luciferase family)